MEKAMAQLEQDIINKKKFRNGKVSWKKYLRCI